MKSIDEQLAAECGRDQLRGSVQDLALEILSAKKRWCNYSAGRVIETPDGIHWLVISEFERVVSLSPKAGIVCQMVSEGEYNDIGSLEDWLKSQVSFNQKPMASKLNQELDDIFYTAGIKGSTSKFLLAKQAIRTLVIETIPRCLSIKK